MDMAFGRKNDDEANQPSLLVQALGIPTLRRDHFSSSSRTASSLHSNGSSSQNVTPPLPESFLPIHSDFTIPTSNVSLLEAPERLSAGGCDNYNDGEATSPRRAVLGGRVQTKYAIYRDMPQTNTTIYARRSSSSSTDTMPTEHYAALETYSHTPLDVTPPSSPRHHLPDLVSPLTPYCDITPTKQQQRRLRAHETIHAQSLLLGLAFLAIWSPQNIMAPNLTEMAEDFGFSPAERDFYLGANVALATGVLSLPLSAGIGFLADVCNRKHLFVATTAAGALFAWATGVSRTYRWLFVARLFNGGCMSGSVPVAFSLLGDLFDTHERNAASSGLTAMMGMGIIAGQVYAGLVGSTLGWSHPFFVSSMCSSVTALLVLFFVQEPVRGGKERVLQDMLKQGTRYERKLTWGGFSHAMQHNRSNVNLLWQGFFSSVPWGIIFVFLNDYLSQERGFSVPDATYLVLIFGVGCAAGGVLGGYWGQLFQSWNRSYLPLFMAATTFLGIFPFLLLLNSSFTNAHSVRAVLYSFLGGCIASLPSVNVRPCLINVNAPETRGAALTAANLIINFARGAGPSCITLMGAFWGVNRRFSFNVTLIFFWTVSAVQMLFLTCSLPQDEDAMEAELAQYAASALEQARMNMDEDASIVSIEDRMTSFDAGAARESLRFMGDALREISDEFRTIRPVHTLCQHNESDEDEDEPMDTADMEHRRNLWLQQQQAISQGVVTWNDDARLKLNGSRRGRPTIGRAFANERTTLLR